MDLLPQAILFQSSILSVLNLIVQELDPKTVCLSLNFSSTDSEPISSLTFETPSIVIDCDNLNFYEVFKQGISLGCSVSTLFTFYMTVLGM